MFEFNYCNLLQMIFQNKLKIPKGIFEQSKNRDTITRGMHENIILLFCPGSIIEAISCLNFILEYLNSQLITFKTYISGKTIEWRSRCKNRTMLKINFN